MKKIIALACTLVMLVSMFAVSANAATEGCTATLEFAGYEVKGTATFAKIVVKATIPDTLVPYEMIAADWVETFEDTYKGKMIQGVGFDIPYVDGLTYVASLSSAASYVQIQDNKSASKLSVYAANSGSYDTYYAGEVDVLATLYYRITGDVDAEYAVNLSAANIGLVDMNADGTATPYGYTTDDFTITNAVVKPEAPEFTPETVKGEVVEGDDADIVLPKSEGSANTHTYTNVATFVATLGADVNYSEAGFIWVANDVESANKFVATDDEAVSGEGTFEYGVVMAGIPAEVDIDAIPYYVTAE